MISTTGFLDTFHPACDTSNTHEGIAVWVPSHYDDEMQAKARSSRTSAVEKSSLLAVSVRNVQNRSPKPLRLYPKVVNFFLKTFATDYANEEFDAKIL